MTGTSFPTNTPRPPAPGAFPPPPAAPDSMRAAAPTDTTYFSVTSPASELKLKAARVGQLSISVTNLTGHPRRVALQPVPADGAAPDWFTVVGEAEREFGLGETESYTVKVKVPPSVPAGSYAVRFDASAEDQPQEVFTAGPTIAVVVGPPPKKRNIPKWAIVAAVAAVIAIIVGVVVLAGGDDEADAPNVLGVPGTEAIRVLGQEGFRTDPTVAAVQPCDAPVASQQIDGDTVRLTFAACAQLRNTPNLVGARASVVTNQLNRLGFSIEVVQAGNAPACDPQVIAQAPGARVRTNTGATIVILLPEEPAGCNLVDALPQAVGRDAFFAAAAN
jgi:hypothetical protein